MGLTDLFDISLERANQFYTWGWRFSVAGAVITMLGIAALWLGTRVRDHDFESKISETTLSAEQLHKDNLTLQTNLEKERIARLQLEGELAKVRKRQEPRGTPVDLMAAILRNAPASKVIVLRQKGDRDAALFADKVQEALTMGGWEILETKVVDDVTARGAGQGDMMFWMRSLNLDSPSMAGAYLGIKRGGIHVGRHE